MGRIEDVLTIHRIQVLSNLKERGREGGRERCQFFQCHVGSYHTYIENGKGRRTNKYIKCT